MADREKKKKSGFSFRKLIYNDKYLIVISVILAVIFWVITSMNLSPETTKAISIPVAVDFSDTAAEQLGLKCFSDETVDVEVTISCKKYLAKDITADDINISLQSNAVTSSGNYDVPIKVDTNGNADFTVVSYYPTVYKGYFDFEDEKSMDVDIQYPEGDFIEDGYVMGQPMLSDSTVTVRGPRSYVSQVTSVSATVNIENKLKETTSMDLVLGAFDSNGSKVNYITVETGGEGFSVTIPVLKEMVLDVGVSFSGKPGKLDTGNFDISYSVDRVNAGVLEDANIEKAVVGSIDFSKLRVGDNEFTFNVESLEGFVILDNIKEIDVTVTVPSDYTEKTVSVNTGNVKVINVPDGYGTSVTGLSTGEVTVIGTEEELEKISSGEINLVVDLSNTDKDKISEGTSSYAVTSSVNNSDTCWIYGDCTANVRISKE